MSGSAQSSHQKTSNLYLFAITHLPAMRALFAARTVVVGQVLTFQHVAHSAEVLSFRVSKENSTETLNRARPGLSESDEIESTVKQDAAQRVGVGNDVGVHGTCAEGHSQYIEQKRQLGNVREWVTALGYRAKANFVEFQGGSQSVEFLLRELIAIVEGIGQFRAIYSAPSRQAIQRESSMPECLFQHIPQLVFELTRQHRHGLRLHNRRLV